jgi:hypothetical protein
MTSRTRCRSNPPYADSKVMWNFFRMKESGPQGPRKGQDRRERAMGNGKLQSPVMSPAQLPPAECYASLPKSITGAGVILHDTDGRFLLARPCYRDDRWVM